ncbi:helicase [Orgyia leucostigma nucleopolyhedrovirus]|uniref:Helicase n=1 Tax=Orgyia leucostigma nucleopolyhedrovirus TaxID=490711 RepID=B0FDV1_9ABAC|nr:helicase [Orgyia leucostigma nucleopolyhedrovirus]ABY65809.1 helicase [Orgyia leucostigma nucleopolyhedrovirus]
MAADPISVNDIFESIFNECYYNEDTTMENFDTVDTVILRNDSTQCKRVVKSLANFQRLVQIMSNDRTGLRPRAMCFESHDKKIEPHDWSVRGDCFVIAVKPFIDKQHYDTIKDDVNFNQFLQSNRKDYGNECKTAGDYYYWPNIPISYFGWRQFLQMRFGIDIGEFVPLVHHRRLGNVNLFEFYPEFFLNVELSLTCNNKKLFVNGRTEFNDNHDDLFHVTMADGTRGLCKVNDNLVYSNKNFLDYIRDDINLTECTTSEKYRQFVKVNLKSLRLFKEVPETKKHTTAERLKVSNVITASSENDDIENHVVRCLTLVNDHMTGAMATSEAADGDVLRDYLKLSNFINFDYVIIVIWRLIIKNNDFEFCETDIRLYLELLCEKLYERNTKDFDIVFKRCEPYTLLLPKVFTRFCNHWTLFNDEDALETLAYYFAIHYLIYNKLSQSAVSVEDCWNYSYDNVLNCGASLDVMCKGFFKKIQSANACLVFNGKHYVSVKKDDDLFKLTEKSSSITMSSVKFNNWKYLYFTDEGVYNVFINSYHTCTPFILGNTLMGALTKKNEQTYLPESVINFMLDTGKVENDIYKMYHVAKLCRDVKTLKNNTAVVVAFANCDKCKIDEQLRFNDLFREIWDFNVDEFIVMGVYLNEKKMLNLVTNLKCFECQQRKNAAVVNNSFKRCECYKNIEVGLKTFKIIMMIELLSNDAALIELVWSLLYTSSLYSKMLSENAHSLVENDIDRRHVIENAVYFHTNRRRIVRCLYKTINETNYVDELIDKLSNFDVFLHHIKSAIECDETQCGYYDASNEKNDCTQIQHRIDHMGRESSIQLYENHTISDDDENDDTTIDNYYNQYNGVLGFLNKWNVWWDKLIVARNNDDLGSWLTRFYTRVIMSKVNLSGYSHFFIKNVVMGYLYFRNFTNFNYINALLMMHFDASLGIPSDFEKCCIYCTGEPGSGKSSNAELMEQIFVVHKHDADSYTLSKKETDEMEANKLISQLYVINEMKECNDSFFKTTADSTKSNAVCRKYQGSQKYEANYKLMIINNKPLHISNYDKGVRNRFAIVYMAHEFEENLPFSGSVYSHIKTKKFPMEKTYYEGLVKPVRLFLSHILMYKRNKKDGYVSYKHIIKHDPVHNHNLMCLDVNNSTTNALIYILKVKVKNGAMPIDECKIEQTVEMAAPYVELMIHDAMKLKRNASRVAQLCSDFKKRFKKYYREEERAYYNLTMAFVKEDFNVTAPTFQC